MSLMVTEITIGTDVFLIFIVIALPNGINKKYNINAVLIILKTI
jgi:hypothetical protein